MFRVARMLTLSSLLLVSYAAKAQSSELKDFSQKGPEYAPLENLRFATTDVAFLGSENVDILGKTYPASRYRLTATVSAEVANNNGSGFVKQPTDFDIFVVDDKEKSIHDQLVAEIYSGLSNRNRSSDVHPSYVSSKEGQYVLSMVYEKKDERPFATTWANGRAIRVSLADEKLTEWLRLDTFAWDDFRISLRNSLLQPYSLPAAQDNESAKEFLRLYQNGFFPSAKPQATPPTQQSMNNDTIAKMITAGLSDDVMIKTIVSSSGSYDTSPAGLVDLRAAGASLRVIAAIQRKAAQAVSNDSIVNMIKAGLSDDIILKTINANSGSYDTSADGLNALKASGAGDRVIAAVLRKSGAAVISRSFNMPPAAKAPETKAPEIKEPEQMGKVFYLNPVKKALDPLPGEAWKRKNRSTGFGSSKSVDIVTGPRASFRVSSKEELVFVFRPLPGQFLVSKVRIYPFEVRGQQRETVISAYKSGFGGSTNEGSQTAVLLDFKRYGVSSFALNPPDFHLDPGEYWFSLPGANLDDPLITFGVD